jgi:hypothetical protein
VPEEKRSCPIRVSVLLAGTRVSLVLTCDSVSFAFLLTITPLHPHNYYKKGEVAQSGRERGTAREDRQVRQGFECARQTATRKEREGKGTFFLLSSFLGFLFRIHFIRSFVLSDASSFFSRLLVYRKQKV